MTSPGMSLKLSSRCSELQFALHIDDNTMWVNVKPCKNLGAINLPFSTIRSPDFSSNLGFDMLDQLFAYSCLRD